MNTKLMMIGGLCLMAMPRLNAATWTVDSNPGRPADYRSLQAAHDATEVVAGDVLHLVASTVSYGGLTAIKPLTIIGPGYLLNQNLSFSVAAPSARTDGITFAPGSDGSLITGCEVAGTVTLDNANNVTIKRNYVQAIIFAIKVGDSNSSNIQILQNYVAGNVETWNQEKPNSGITIRGNYCGGNMNCDDAGDYVDVQFNTIAGYLDIGGSSYAANNIIAGTLYLYHTSFGEYNWRWSSSNVAQEGVAYDWSSVSYADQFVNTGSIDARRQLVATSPVRGTAKDGSDPGMYSGPDPYVISGLPSVPMVIGVQAPSSASAASGLPVTVTLQANP